jgi:hypothetical protein
MEIDEGRRIRMVERFHDVFGSEVAETVMSYLPPGGWGDVATRGDLAGLRGEFAGLRGEFAGLRGEFAELRGEFAELRGEVRASTAELRGEMYQQISGVRGEISGLRAEMHTEIGALRRDSRSMFLGLLGIVAAYGAGLVAAVRVH